MTPTEKKGILGLIQSANWDDKAQLTDCISSLCNQFNEQHSIEEDIDDETRVQKLNELSSTVGLPRESRISLA